jgi:Uncharacterized protein conserved in bacteria (DUF2252)
LNDFDDATGPFPDKRNAMNCKKATESYETWLAKHTRIVDDDLRLKHQQMSADMFSFMRATFYRWVELWAEHCPDLARAPVVLAVGDLHVENFGTWRDQEGRLVWGINDFDEAFPLPYTNDLVRLALSAHLAISANHLKIRTADACEAILKGYTEGIRDGGSPFVLAGRHEWLRSAVTSQLRDPVRFWEKLASSVTVTAGISAKAKKALAAALPEKKLKYRMVHRVAGLGSLGRPRFVALAEWNGGLIAREAKALLSSACVWANQEKDSGPQYGKIMKQAIRCPDPFLELRKGWVVRRLAPDCSRVELTMLSKGRDEYKLLEAMGRETANVHLGTSLVIAKVKRDMSRKQPGWLHDAAKAMVQATVEDWRKWCG